MPPLAESIPEKGLTGPAYWRSLEHLADTPEFRAFVHREFPAGATDLLDSGERRRFLKIMGASMALAGLGLTGCRRWPAEAIVPYARRPEGRDPGVSERYATSMEVGGVAMGLLATSNDGRPTKIEGNPDHPASRGAADLFAQASVLDLYDVDRSRGVLRDGQASTWQAFVEWIQTQRAGLQADGGRGLVVLSEATSSPSLLRMRAQLEATYPNATWCVYEPFGQTEVSRGARLAFGRPYRPQHDFETPATIVSLDADFLGTDPNAVANIRSFARGRALDGPHAMSRLYAFESDLTVTGANADHRVAVRSVDVAVVAAFLAARVLGEESLRAFEQDAATTLSPKLRETLEHVVEDLEGRGPSLIVAGPRQPAEIHLLVNLMNETLGNVGTTITYTREPGPVDAVSIADVAALTPSLLVILGGNPVFNAPADVDVAALIGRAAATVHLGAVVDETSAMCNWHVNRAHYLEAWGDGRAWDGTLTLAQPLIEPLFGGKTAAEVVGVLAGEASPANEAIVRATFDEVVGGGDAAWRRVVHDGYLSGSAMTPERPTARRNELAASTATLLDRWRSAAQGWELVFALHPTIHDGRFANNGWLQELPDPISKLTWDNALLISPATAEELRVSTGDMMTVEAGGTSLELPVFRLPGIAAGSAVVHVGYGRRFEGRISSGAGFDVYPLRTTAAMGHRTDVALTKSRGTYPLASTQDHHTIDVDTVGGRGVQERLPGLFREATLDQFRANPNFANDPHHTGAHVVHRLSLWPEDNLEGGTYAWGMSIDLNKCVGCNACIVACQAENNIPIVGKDQVLRGRELHWIRVDRYFKFAETDGAYDPNHVTSVALQPVTCMQCENAPCEQVCPVAATVHDQNGLNVMVYNRCIGTRYCSNNCPYKVRRFNYFDYHRREPLRTQPGTLLQVDPTYYTKRQATPDPLKQLQFNPDVTVRMRGVMEKCTYCVQRINEAQIETKNDFARQPEGVKAAQQGRRIAIEDGVITPACAQTCPAEAIVFGDLHDASSRVAQTQRDGRSYQMLEELNVDARTRYLARVTNPGFGAPAPGGHGGHGGQDHSGGDHAEGGGAGHS